MYDDGINIYSDADILPDAAATTRAATQHIFRYPVKLPDGRQIILRSSTELSKEKIQAEARKFINKKIPRTNVGAGSILIKNTNDPHVQNFLNTFKLTDQMKSRIIELGDNLELVKDPAIKQYIETVEVGDATNREGIGAGVYFRAIYGDEFKRKVNISVQNSALNYGYAVLTSKVAKIIAGKGLLNYIGIHHKNEYNRFNLACDVVEVFRPIVDYYVAKHLKEASYFAKEDRIELLNLMNSKILYQGRKEFLTNCIEKYVEAIINYFENGEEIESKIPTLEGLEFYEL